MRWIVSECTVTSTNIIFPSLIATFSLVRVAPGSPYVRARWQLICLFRQLITQCTVSERLQSPGRHAPSRIVMGKRQTPEIRDLFTLHLIAANKERMVAITSKHKWQRL